MLIVGYAPNRPIYEKQARANQLSGLKQNQNTVSQNSSKRTEPIDVRAKLAETAERNFLRQ